MQFGQPNRRSFITLLGGAAAWPLAARGQQSDRIRRIGVLFAQAAEDPKYQAALGLEVPTTAARPRQRGDQIK
jgi:hypothetical protein